MQCLTTLLRTLKLIFWLIVASVYTLAFVEFLLFDGSRGLTLTLWP
jgi:hypothetical protein